jgi:hypothetical protein
MIGTIEEAINKKIMQGSSWIQHSWILRRFGKTQIYGWLYISE